MNETDDTFMAGVYERLQTDLATAKADRLKIIEEAVRLVGTFTYSMSWTREKAMAAMREALDTKVKA